MKHKNAPAELARMLSPFTAGDYTRTEFNDCKYYSAGLLDNRDHIGHGIRTDSQNIKRDSYSGRYK